MHIVAYLFIIVVNALQFMPVAHLSNRSYKIATICNLVVYFVCTLVFGLIVNYIVTKIQAITSHLESITYSLMTAAVASDLVYQTSRQSINIV